MEVRKWLFTNLRTLNSLSLEAEETGNINAKWHKELANGITVFNLFLVPIIDFNVLLDSYSVCSLKILILHKMPSKSVTLDMSDFGRNNEKALLVSSIVMFVFKGTDKRRLHNIYII